jgi:hypothetical protein
VFIRLMGNLKKELSYNAKQGDFWHNNIGIKSDRGLASATVQ